MNGAHRAIRITSGPSAPAEGPGGHDRPEHRADPQTPLIDIREEADSLILEADLPGASEDGVCVELTDNVLTLHARVEAPTLAGARLIHQEYRGSPFSRSFILGDEIDRLGITAEMGQGVLRLVLPKAERARPRRIEIRTPGAE